MEKIDFLLILSVVWVGVNFGMVMWIGLVEK